MKAVCCLEISVEVEIDDKFKTLDVPYEEWDSISHLPKEFFDECANAARQEVIKTYPYYKDLAVYAVYGSTGNALCEY